MKFSRFAYLTVLFTLLFSFVSAQTLSTESKTEKDKAKEKLEKEARELVEDVVNEADSLKLWENRALILGFAGDLLCFGNKRQIQQEIVLEPQLGISPHVISSKTKARRDLSRNRRAWWS